MATETSLFPLGQMTEIPPIGSPVRERDEEAALALGRQLLVEEDGSIRHALVALEDELRGPGGRTLRETTVTRRYARRLVSHVEQCWATAVLR